MTGYKFLPTGNHAIFQYNMQMPNMHQRWQVANLEKCTCIHWTYVKEYSSEYSDSAFKVEDTIVSRR